MQALRFFRSIEHRATALYGFVSILPVATAFVLFPFKSAFLAAAEFGISVQVDLAIALVMNVLNFGASGLILSHYVSSSSESPQDPKKYQTNLKRHVFSQGLIMGALGGLLVFGVMMACEGLFETGGFFLRYGWVICIVGGVSALNASLISFYRSDYQLRVVLLLTVGPFLATTVGAVLGLWLQYGLEGFIFGRALGFLIGLTPGYIWLVWFGGLRLLFDRKLCFQFLSKGWPLVISALLAILSSKLDRVIAMTFFDQATLGAFAVAATVAVPVECFLMAQWHAFSPRAMEEIERYSQRGEDVSLLRLNALVWGVWTRTLLLIFAISIVGEDLLALVASSDLLRGASFIGLFASQYIGRLAFWTWSLEIYHSRKTMHFAYSEAISAFTTFTASIFLVQVLGIRGIVLAPMMYEGVRAWSVGRNFKRTVRFTWSPVTYLGFAFFGIALSCGFGVISVSELKVAAGFGIGILVLRGLSALSWSRRARRLTA